MIHYYDTDIAQEYGIEEAVVIHNFAYWISKNAANNTHLYDGRYWTYNSADALLELIPEFKTIDKIKRVIKSLIENDIILKGNYNKTTMDRTCWYAFTDKGLELISRYNISTRCKVQNCQMQSAKMHDGKCENARAIPNIYTDSNIDNDNISHNIINDIIQDNNQKKEIKRKKSELDLSFVSVHFRDVFEQWLAYHKELGCPYKQTGAVAAYNKLLKLSDNDPSIAQKIVEQSMSNNWRGLFSLRNEEYRTRSNNNNWATEFCKNVEQWAGVYK